MTVVENAFYTLDQKRRSCVEEVALQTSYYVMIAPGVR